MEVDNSVLQTTQIMQKFQVQEIYNEQLPNSNEEGFSPIYRRKDLKQLQETPDKSIHSLRDLLKATIKGFGPKEGIGQIKVRNQSNNEQIIEKRTVCAHTYSQVYESAYNMGKVLFSKNMYFSEKLHNMKLIGIYAKNRYQWFVADWSCIIFGLTSVPLYDTLGIQNLSFCLNQTLITTLFVSSATIKTLLKQQDLGRLQNIISFDKLDEQTKSQLKLRELKLFEFWQLIKDGNELSDINDNQIKVNLNDCYTFSYTSGTTGPPKAAMISHKNVLAFVNAFRSHKDFRFSSDDRYLSYLPLPHVMERSLSMTMFYHGAYVVVSSGNKLKIREDCQAIKITVLISVPRIYTRIYQEHQHLLASRSLNETELNTSQVTNLRQSFGGSLKVMFTGSAPLTADVRAFMRANMGCPLIEVYGQTECNAGAIFSRAGGMLDGQLTEIGTGVQVRLCDIPEMNYSSKDVDNQGRLRPRGQICCRGPQVFLGYYNQPDETQSALTNDGWLKTGDVAEFYLQTKHLRLIDRKKNIFKLQQGQYLAPQRIQLVYLKCKLIFEIFLHGDSHQAYAVAVVVPNKEEVKRYAGEKGINGTIEQLCASRIIRKWLLREMSIFGRKQGLYGFELAKNIHLQPNSFMSKGILTSTMKLIRFKARSAYRAQLQRLYEQGQLQLS